MTDDSGGLFSRGAGADCDVAGQWNPAQMIISDAITADSGGPGHCCLVLAGGAYDAAEGFPAERCEHPEPVSVLDGRAVLVTEFVSGKPWPATPAAWRQLGALAGRCW